MAAVVPVLLVLLTLGTAAADAAPPPEAGGAAAVGAGAGAANPRGAAPGSAATRGGPAFARLPTVLTPGQISALKIAVASATALLLLWGALLRRAGRPRAYRRGRDRALVALGLLGGLCWWNALHFHQGTYVHWWEVYHYYVGAKYFPELGYERLYTCSLVADAEDGALPDAGTARVRDLDTNQLVRASAILADPTGCTRHFRLDRWEAFRRDNAWFRDQMAPGRWARARQDHGYNATPVWGILGSLLARSGPASPGLVLALTLIDPLLLLLMWGVVLWAFGWRAMSVALVYWGTSYPAEFAWHGGAYLRQDWLAATVIGICLLRREKMAAAGVALGTAALLRVFPALILGGIALKALLDMRSHRTFVPPPEYRRLAAGCAVAVIVLAPASWLAVGGADTWLAFAGNARKYLATPFASGMGLRPIVAYEHYSRSRFLLPLGLDEDAAHPWREARRRSYHERRYQLAALVGAFLLLLGTAVRREPLWVAAVLSVGLIPVAGELPSYYYSVLLAFGLLSCRHELVGPALCALAALTSVVPWLLWWNDEKYLVISAATVAFVIMSTAYAAWGGMRRPAPEG